MRCSYRKVACVISLGLFCGALFSIISFLDFVSLLSEGPCRPEATHCGTPFDLRVTKGFGTRGYNQVRITVISTNATPPVEGFFSYSEQFRYKWMQNHLHSTMLEIDSSGSSVLPGFLNTTVRLPPRGAGVAGVLIADPCVVSSYGRTWVPCSLGNEGYLDTMERIPALLNAFVGNNDTDYWGLLGDNFYDRTGRITTDVMSRISTQVKSKIFYAVPGNHDFWVYGNPVIGSTSDQCGNAFMQYYAQDTKAAEHATGASPPFNFQVDPDEGSFLRWGCTVPHYSNFFYYNQLGNVGIIGQSGAHSGSEVRSFMLEACAWLPLQPMLDVALLIGHWDTKDMGADSDMSMPNFYDWVKLLPGCQEFDERGMLMFVTGHTHCNTPHPHESKKGYRVAGFGMEGDGGEGCNNDDMSFGIPIFDTTDSRVRFWYFDTSTDELYYDALNCSQTFGWRSCTDKIKTAVWLDVPINRSGKVDDVPYATTEL